MSGVGDICKQLEKSLNLAPTKLDEKLRLNKAPIIPVTKKISGNNQINQADILNGLNLIKKSSNNSKDLPEKINDKPTPQKKPAISPSKKLSEQNISISSDGNILPFSKPLKPVVASKPRSLSNASSFSESRVLLNSSNLSEQNSDMKHGDFIKSSFVTHLQNAGKNVNCINNNKCAKSHENNEVYDNANDKCDNTAEDNNEIYDDVLQGSDYKVIGSEKTEEGIEIYDDVNNSNIFNNILETSEIIIQEEGEIYDDVNNSDNHSNHIKTIENNNTDNDEVYDDVTNPAVSIFLAEINSAPETDEFYDDINNPVDAFKDNENDEIYDDINNPAEPKGDPEDSEIYDDVNDLNLSDKKSEPLVGDIHENNKPQAPVKFLKSFSSVDQSLFNAPNGLEVWLKKLLNENHNRIKNVTGMPLQLLNIQTNLKHTDLNSGSNAEGNHSSQPGIVYQAEKDFVQGYQKKMSLGGEKDEKRIDKEELKLRKKTDKKEKEKEKAERKKKIKEYKLFGLDVDKDLISIGEFVCKSTYSSKKKDSLDLSFQYGDEVNVIEFPTAPSGKVLTKRVSDGKLGYILKAELGIPEEEPERSERPRCQSLIPTEDELEGPEVYEMVAEAAPPIPIRPRPQIQFEGLRNTQREELMRIDVQKAINNNNDQEDELYQEL